MPCYDSRDDPAWQLGEEKRINLKELGREWSDLSFATNVACAYAKLVKTGAPLPEWAAAWTRRHEERDRKKAQEIVEERQRRYNNKLVTFNKLKKELGK